MAKFNEADPRWLVQDMGKQGTNVNGWHWQTKKDVSSWIRDRIQVSHTTRPNPPSLHPPGASMQCAKRESSAVGRSVGRSVVAYLLLFYGTLPSCGTLLSRRCLKPNPQRRARSRAR